MEYTEMDQELWTIDNLPEGHPADTLRRENAALTDLINELEQLVNNEAPVEQILAVIGKLREIKAHFSKKEELLFPLMTNYGMTAMPEVMWDLDDEIQNKLRKIQRTLTDENFEEMSGDLHEVIGDMWGMLFKEDEMMLSQALQTLSKEDWYAVYQDQEEMGTCFGIKPAAWPEAEEWLASKKHEEQNGTLPDGLIQLPTGALNVRQMEQIFSLLPVDVTFIDENNIIRFFTNKQQLVGRPLSCLGREVFLCHPPRLIPMIENMIEQFRAGEKDVVTIWKPHSTTPVRFQYMAVRDEEGNYLGTFETIQDFGDVVDHISKG